jgi:hypothetical protein
LNICYLILGQSAEKLNEQNIGLVVKKDKERKMKAKEFITEKWSQKYKNSINCSHPKGFSQRAHCAGKKKHNEDVTMEHVCPDCGMCQTHGNLNEIKKGAKDSNGYTKCWPGKHAEGTKRGKNGGLVRNCVPNESVAEGSSAITDEDVADLIHDIAVNLIFNKQRMSINETDPTMVAKEVHKAYKMEGIPFTQTDLDRVLALFPKVMKRLRKGFRDEGDMYEGDTELAEERACNECGMLESKCGCDHSVNEDYKHKGKAYGGAAQKDDDEDDNTEDDTPKKRGAPKKKDSERSDAKHPKFDNTRDYKLPAHKGTTHKHSMSDEPPRGTPERAEWEAKQARRDKASARKKSKVKENFSKLEARFREVLGEGRMVDESGETLAHIMNRFKHEVKQFEHGQDLDEDLYHALYDYYCDHGEMPYGTAKARTGDPHEWVTLRLDQELKDNPMDEAAPYVPGGAKGGIPGAVPGVQNIKPQSTGIMGAIKDTAKGIMGHKDTDHYELTVPQDESANSSLKHDLDELAKLAGLEIEEDTHGEYLDQLKTDAKAHHKSSVHAFGQDIPVEESTTLEDIARLSGIAIEGRDYGDTKINEPAHFDNTPEEEVMDAEVMLRGGDGEVAGKEKKMSKNGAARFSDNPMEAVDPLEAMGRKLMKQYEAIKIQK